MKKSFLNFVVIIIALVAGLFILTGCSSKESYEKDKEREYYKAVKNNDVEAVNKFRNEKNNSHSWTYDSNSGVKNVQAPIDKSDDMQKIVHSFNCSTYEHSRTLNYEPLTNSEGRSSHIPAYEQKCIWTCSELPEHLNNGDSITITLEGKYVGKNEYAGIIDNAWIYTNDERISITNNDGYTKENCFVGSGKEGSKESLNTSFTITVSDKDDSKDDIEIYFETFASTTVFGTTVFRYQWE